MLLAGMIYLQERPLSAHGAQSVVWVVIKGLGNQRVWLQINLSGTFRIPITHSKVIWWFIESDMPWPSDLLIVTCNGIVICW